VELEGTVQSVTLRETESDDALSRRDSVSGGRRLEGSLLIVNATLAFEPLPSELTVTVLPAIMPTNQPGISWYWPAVDPDFGYLEARVTSATFNRLRAIARNPAHLSTQPVTFRFEVNDIHGFDQVIHSKVGSRLTLAGLAATLLQFDGLPDPPYP